MRAAEVTLLEKLDRVPNSARAEYEHSPTEHSMIPYGLYCHLAAHEIRKLTAAVARAETQHEADRIDAERYRQVRRDAEAMTGDKMDAAVDWSIDAARKGE